MIKLLKCLLIAYIFMSCTEHCIAETDILNNLDCGKILVGQTKVISIPIINQEKEPLVIDYVTVCCGNPKPKINVTTIMAGDTAKLVQEIRKTRPKAFTVTTSVVLSKPQKKTINFIIKGVATQPISAQINWQGKNPIEVDYSQDYTFLDKENELTKGLFIKLENKESPKMLKDNFDSMKSNYFLFNKLSFHDEALNILCNPISPLPIGELSDEIVIKFRDGSLCYIPIRFRVVGDIYGETSLLGIGQIPETGNIEKNFKIIFSKKNTIWRNLKWSVDGKLAPAIKISYLFDDTQSISVNIKIIVKEIPLSLKGFVSSKIFFHCDENADNNKVSLLVYGIK